MPRDGLRLTAFATNTIRGQLPDLELRHRRRARCEDRIRNAKDTGLANLPLHDFDQNRIWCALVQLACELTAWLQMLALHDHHARRWEPNGYGCGCFRSPPASPDMPAKPDSGWPPTPPGPACSLPRWPVYNPADQHHTRPNYHERNRPGPKEPGRTR